MQTGCQALIDLLVKQFASSPAVQETRVRTPPGAVCTEKHNAEGQIDIGYTWSWGVVQEVGIERVEAAVRRVGVEEARLWSAFNVRRRILNCIQ